MLRDIHRNCIVIDTRFSPMAMIFPLLAYTEPPLGGASSSLFDLRVDIGSTLGAVLTYVVWGVYFRKAHLVLRRSFAMMRGRHIWLVLAENLKKR